MSVCIHASLNVHVCQQCIQYMCVCQYVCVHTRRGGLMYFCPISQWPNSPWLSQSHSVVVMDSLYHHNQSPCLHYSGTPLNSTRTWRSPNQGQLNQYRRTWPLPSLFLPPRKKGGLPDTDMGFYQELQVRPQTLICFVAVNGANVHSAELVNEWLSSITVSSILSVWGCKKQRHLPV